MITFFPGYHGNIYWQIIVNLRIKIKTNLITNQNLHNFYQYEYNRCFSKSKKLVEFIKDGTFALGTFIIKNKHQNIMDPDVPTLEKREEVSKRTSK